MGLATDFRSGLSTLFRRKPKPALRASRRIYAYTDKIYKSSGGAPDKLVAIYKAHALRHKS